MKATISIENMDRAEVLSHPAARLDGDSNSIQATEQAPEIQAEAPGHGSGTGRPESELRPGGTPFRSAVLGLVCSVSGLPARRLPASY